MPKTMPLHRWVILLSTAVLGLFVTVRAAPDSPAFCAVFTVAWGVAVALTWRAPSWLQTIFAPSPKASSERDWVWTLAGLVLVAGSLAWLEFRLGYYFAQDDNHSCYLPVWITAAQSFFKTGSLPTWNGYQFLGTPTASLGIYALTYPVTYLAYAVARFVLGNELWAMEVFGFVHFLAGYALTVLTLRCLSVRPVLAAAAAVGFTLLGFNLIAGRSWFYMIPTVAYLPALAWSVACFAENETRPSRRWTLGTALAIGLYFHSGSAQMWLYGVLFWGGGILWSWFSGDRQWSRLRPAIAAGLLGVALSLPLLIVQADETKGIPRKEYNENIVAGLDGLILPWPLVETPLPWGNVRTSNTGFFFSGGVFVILFFLQCAGAVAWLAAGKVTRRELAPLGIGLAAIVALVFALGPAGGAWTIFRQIPPFDKFRIPFRLLPFATFFMIAAGSLLAERLSGLIRAGKHFALVLAAVSAAASIWSATLSTVAFFDFKEHPYPPLGDDQKAWAVDGFTDRGRVFPLGPWRSGELGYSHALMQNYATFYRVPSAKGYDTDSLEQHLPETAAANKLATTNLVTFLQEFGVERVTVFSPKGELKLNPAKAELFRKLASTVEQGPERAIYNVRDATATKPMAYLLADQTRRLRYDIRGNGVDVETPAATGSSVLIANFLHRHWLRAYDHAGRPLQHMADPVGRIAIAVPPGTSRVSIRYAPPWWQGVAAGGVLAIFAAWAMGLLGSRFTVRRIN